MFGLGNFLRDLKRGFSQLLVPNTCWACECHLPEQEDSFCNPCMEKVAMGPLSSCWRCGASVGPHVPLNAGCVHCREQSFNFHRVLRFGIYDGMLRELILRLKQPGGEDLADALAIVFARHMAKVLQPYAPDLVIPVPLHWLRYLKRRFNQSEVLARNLAASLKVPYQRRLLWRIRATPSQTTQTPAQRRENIKGAFRARNGHWIEGKTVVLVDDVLTTGSTAHEASKALSLFKPKEIIVCILARARIGV